MKYGISKIRYWKRRENRTDKKRICPAASQADRCPKSPKMQIRQKPGQGGSFCRENRRITDPHTVCHACVMVRKQADAFIKLCRHSC